jgi:hypothetical protein
MEQIPAREKLRRNISPEECWNLLEFVVAYGSLL